MKNKKGFTLVELLAVIVILAVLVLLAVPSVIKMMDNAKKNAFTTEAGNIIKATTLAYADGVMNGVPQTCYQLSDLTDYLDKNLEGYSGSVAVDIENNTYQIWLSNGNYVIDGDYRGNLSVVKSEAIASTECRYSLAYKVTYEVNGGTTLNPNNKSVEYGELYGELPTPTREDYNFLGWFTKLEGGSEITSTTEVAIEGPHTLNQWV